ncbi:unnamed protein product [Hymenolepis diminuta]|uniref:Uncharacterized protein n=1 Tax=Hymenolepis diminuta TaxID=6216 RepID=A0A564YS06_HYMDI|nr:unnamed protein product [Hymenolepis diminuta]
MFKHAHRFHLPFSLSITTTVHLKGISALMLSRGLTQNKNNARTPLLRFLLISSLPQQAPLSISISVTRFKLLVVSLSTFLA